MRPREAAERRAPDGEVLPHQELGPCGETYRPYSTWSCATDNRTLLRCAEDRIQVHRCADGCTAVPGDADTCR